MGISYSPWNEVLIAVLVPIIALVTESMCSAARSYHSLLVTIKATR